MCLIWAPGELGWIGSEEFIKKLQMTSTIILLIEFLWCISEVWSAANEFRRSFSIVSMNEEHMHIYWEGLIHPGFNSSIVNWQCKSFIISRYVSMSCAKFFLKSELALCSNWSFKLQSCRRRLNLLKPPKSKNVTRQPSFIVN